jgi:hypothetical protein
MADSGAPEKKLDHITVYPEDKKEMDRLFGDNVSYAKRQHAIVEIIKRERLVDKVRRKILSPLDDVYLLLYHFSRGEQLSPRESPMMGSRRPCPMSREYRFHRSITNVHP